MATLEEVILAWRADNGGRIPVKSEERKDAFRNLFATLMDYDLLDAVKIKSNQLRIVNACVNPTSKKLNNWKAAVEVDLQVVMHEAFEEIKIRKATAEDFKLRTPEHKTYVPPEPKPEPLSPPKTEVELGYKDPTGPTKSIANPDWMPTTMLDEDFLKKIGGRSE